jgi:hypothetical protein
MGGRIGIMDRFLPWRGGSIAVRHPRHAAHGGVIVVQGDYGWPDTLKGETWRREEGVLPERSEWFSSITFGWHLSLLRLQIRG